MVEDVGFVYLLHNESQVLQSSVDQSRDASIISLIINNGLFLNEVTQLKLEAINWAEKTLHIDGKRARKLPLNGQTLALMTTWSQKRVDCKTDHFFITTKGKVSPLSARSVDNLIRKYAKKAGINKVVNARVLRNTFAVRLFETGLSEMEVAALLGVTNQDFLKRYQNGAKKIQTGSESSLDAMEKLDTRNPFTKLKDRLIKAKPKSHKILSKLEGAITPHPKETLFGRVSVLREMEASLKKKQSVLLTGIKGSGKTHLLKHLDAKFEKTMYVMMNRPMKRLLQEICGALNTDYKSQLPSRPAIEDYVDWLKDQPALGTYILLLDDIDTVNASVFQIIELLISKSTVLASCSGHPKKVSTLKTKLKEVELHALTEDAATTLISYLTQNMSITDYTHLETQLLEKSNLYPGPIVDMVKQLYYESVVDSDAIRQLRHDASTTYRDWSAAIVVMWGILIMLRFVALGTHSFEGYILAGFGTSILITARFFMRKMS
tara:strand:- start:2127 stop:3602 length:1476 start_codon:yes stop_codon:yes gene_type:complete